MELPRIHFGTSCLIIKGRAINLCVRYFIIVEILHEFKKSRIFCFVNTRVLVDPKTCDRILPDVFLFSRLKYRSSFSGILESAGGAAGKFPIFKFALALL